MMSQKKIMIVAGGEWQVPLIQKAKEKGHYVINSNLYEDSIGFKYADVGVVADVMDLEKNLEVAKKYSPDAIITDQSDIAVPTVAYLCDQLDLPGIGMKQAELFTNKYMMREFCVKHDLPSPRYKLCNSFIQVKDFVKEIGYPLIIKPINNQSSRGVNRVDNFGDLEQFYMDTLKNSQVPEVLIEEFIGGTELTVEGIKTLQKHVTLGISRKMHFQEKKTVASKLLYSPTHPEMDYDQLRKQNNKMVEKMGLPFGITHAEYKYWNGKFYLIEIAARGGGTKISSHIVPAISGIDTNEWLINMALGKETLEIEVKQRDMYVLLEFVQLQEGRVKKICGFEKIKALRFVIDAGLNFKEGDYLYPLIDDRSRHGYFIIFADSEEKLKEQAEKVKEMLVIDYE